MEVVTIDLMNTWNKKKNLLYILQKIRKEVQYNSSVRK